MNSFPDGERRLTNVLHLAEILQHASIEKNLGISGLVKWLAKQRDSSSPRLEEHQLRLESDENAVKIVTKGPQITIWLNGEEIVDYKSDRRTKGYLGLQNHDERAVIRFRNLRITEQG